MRLIQATGQWLKQKAHNQGLVNVVGELDSRCNRIVFLKRYETKSAGLGPGLKQIHYKTFYILREGFEPMQNLTSDFSE